MPYSDPKRAEEYWAYCKTNDAKCQQQAKCSAAGKCLDDVPSQGPSSDTVDSCQAYPYCPKRHNCMAAARCLDARVGPPRRLSLKTTDIAKEYTDSSSLTHKPLAEVPEDRKATPEGLRFNPFDVGKPATRVIVQDDNTKIRVSFHEIELDPHRAIRLGMDLIQAGLRHLERGDADGKTKG